MNMSPSSDLPILSLLTTHGRQRLDVVANETVLQALQRHGIPWSAVSIYAKSSKQDTATPRPCLHERFDSFEAGTELLLLFNRNINPFQFSPLDLKVADANGGAVAEYIYQKLDNRTSSVETILKRLSVDECRAVIAERVAKTVVETLPENTDLVVGISGGGDSNALLHGLTQIAGHGLKIHPVIIMGIPDWDLGVPRAQDLCKHYGLDLTIITEAEVRELLSIPKNGDGLIDRFEREFPGDDFEFLGTLLIRLALFKHAERVGTSYVATGLNLEDVLCEGLYRLSTHQKLAGFPQRKIGDKNLVFPLWLCPKRIIDGCFPKYSLENYEARYPCYSLGRNLYYSVIYHLQSHFPGLCEQLASGMSARSAEDAVTHVFDDQLGFHVEDFVPFPLRQRFLRMTGRTAA